MDAQQIAETSIGIAPIHFTYDRVADKLPISIEVIVRIATRLPPVVRLTYRGPFSLLVRKFATLGFKYKTSVRGRPA